MSAAADPKGMKRICLNCGIRFYDLNKRPIICPGCETEFKGETKVKGRKGRSPAANDDEGATTAKTARKEADADENEEIEESDTVSLDEVEDMEEADNEDEDIDPDADLDLDDDLGDIDDIDEDLDEDLDEIEEDDKD